jgi:hypothetical protein
VEPFAKRLWPISQGLKNAILYQSVKGSVILPPDSLNIDGDGSTTAKARVLNTMCIDGYNGK